MSETVAATLQIAILITALAAIHVPLGEYLARVYESPKHLRVERGLYRLSGIDPDADQRWSVYLRSVIAFSVVGVVALMSLLRLQSVLPWSLDRDPMPWWQSFNTAISFVTNTNWQSYSGESALGYGVQMFGLAVQNFLSAAVGLAVAVAVVRGFARSTTDRLGNFWVDVTRGVIRILLPLSFLIAVVFVLSGVIQTFRGNLDVTTLSGATQTLPGGPVASQEAIKQLGTNGGGFFNANSSHPFENPNGFTNLIQIFLMLAIPFSLPRAFGQIVGDTRQGFAILATMFSLWFASVLATIAAQVAGNGTAIQAAGAATEGQETRFGIPISAVFAASTTATSTGAVDSMHSSYTGLGGGVLILNILLGEVSPGGVGSGLYGMLMLALVTVFIAGLMIGRTPEYLGKRIRSKEMTLVSLYVLATPAVVLLGTGIAMALPVGRASMLNAGPHGLSEVLYAFASAGNNNGSAFAGLNANTDFYNFGLGVAMGLGRFVPMALVLALAGTLAQQARVPASDGTLPTHRPQFVVLLVGVVLLVAGLTYVPALALGPLAEGLR